MTRLLLPVFTLLALCSVALAEPPPTGEVTSWSLAPGGLPVAAADKPWSVVGPWRFSHTNWQDSTKTLTADGLILNDNNRPEGQWTLTTQQGQLHLIIRWRQWSSDDLAMVNANEFYGTDGRTESRLRRESPPPAPMGMPKLGAAVETHWWHQGEPPVKLIRQEDGFCALTGVTGRFQGGGELVRVYVADDGYWYLVGRSGASDVAAECIVIRYRGREKPRVNPSEETPATP